jgi:hypothetical protein
VKRSRRLRRAASRTRSRPIDAPTVRLRVRDAGVCSAFPSASLLPSTVSAGKVPLFNGFFGTMSESDFSTVSGTGLRHIAFPVLPEECSPGTVEISQLPCNRLPGMCRVFDRAGPSQGLRLTPCSVLPSASLNSVGAPDS